MAPHSPSSASLRYIQIRNTFLLLLAAFIWGVTFVPQYLGSQHVDALTFLACRSWIAVAVLTPLAFFTRKHTPSTDDKKARRDLLLGGTVCGTFLFFSCATQQVGVATTTTAEAGFITALYIIFVPLSGLFIGKIPGRRLWFCVITSVIGLFLLCVKESLNVSIGDFWLLLAAVINSGQILAVAIYSPRTDCVSLSAVQFFVISVLSTLGMFLFENPTWENIYAAGGSIAFAGFFSSGIAFTLQIVGQRNLNPTVASLAMSLESVFSALAGWVILGQCLNLKEFIGCCLMFAAIILAQLPERVKK